MGFSCQPTFEIVTSLLSENYFLRFKDRDPARPINPTPNSSMVPGSGTGVWAARLPWVIVRIPEFMVKGCSRFRVITFNSYCCHGVPW